MDYKKVLRLHYVNKLSGQEIALCCKEGSKSSVNEFLKRFRECEELSYPLEEEVSNELIESLLYSKPGRDIQDDCFRDFNKEDVARKLTKKGETILHIWSLYYSEGEVDGKKPMSYRTFCRRFAGWKCSKEITFHIKRSPGENIELDFAGKQLYLHDPDDEEKVVKVTIFVASLSYSDYFYAEAMTKCDIKNWIRVNNNALQYFGGVTPNITPDNCKVAVNKNKDWIDPALNKDFQEWADHNGAVILPAKVRSPQMKPVVENSVKLVTNHILVDMDGMVFYSLEEINRILFKKVDEENRKNFQDLDYSRYDLFVREEKETLLPLPDTKYEYLERKNVKVAQDFSFVFDKVHYSMPRRYLKQELEIRAGEEKIFVYNRHGDLIRTHERSFTPKDWVVVPSDMPKEYNDYGYWNVPYFQQKASNIGPYTRMAIDEVIARFKYPVQSFRSCFGIINFAKRYSKETLESCCKDALIKGRCNYTFISNTIASHYIPPAPKEETPAEPVEVEKGKYKDDDSLYSLKNLLKSQGGSRNEQ